MESYMKFQYSIIASWPSLAWLACCPIKGDVINILHGPHVEVTEEFFCEAVWDGVYDAGGFDETDIIAGSGGRRRGSEVVFVSSGSTIDRLHSIALAGTIWVSNSLPCLLQSIQGTVDPIYPNYFDDFETITKGLTKYRPWLATSAGNVRLTYFHNIVWDGKRLSEQPKPNKLGRVMTFEDYRRFLLSSFQSVAQNLSCLTRNHTWRMLSTTSSGYDSATVTALAAQVGCKETICINRARGGEEDSGQRLAERLGIKPLIVSRDAWKCYEYPEIAFVASDSKGEDIYFKGAEQYVKGRVLFSGFAGGKMWNKKAFDLTENIVREDQSGLSLTEYRLRADFIHCPVPFWGIRSVRDVNAISNAAEMMPWDEGSGYTKPICRRFLEEAGIPRSLFGVRKRAASVLLWKHPRFLTPQTNKDYLRWLKEHRDEWSRQGQKPPVISAWADGIVSSTAFHVGLVTANFLQRAAQMRGVWRLADMPYLAQWAHYPHKPMYLRRHVFPWAIERAKIAYRVA